MDIKFLGAAGMVTGSCYLVEAQGSRILIDCGMFQGVADEAKNYEPFDFDPATINFVILTHSHIDHCGLLPKLVKEGFQGKIYCTQHTKSITTILLRDAAKIQENNAKRNRLDSKPLYTVADSEATIKMLAEIGYGDEVTDRCYTFKLIYAGHVLGAVSVELAEAGSRIVFSGDIGRRDQSVIDSWAGKRESEGVGKVEVDAVVMESLYGGQLHRAREEATHELISTINNVTRSGGNVIIPCFAMHRTQEMLEIFKNAFANRQINSSVQVYLDSPMAIQVTKVYTGAIKASLKPEMHSGEADTQRVMNHVRGSNDYGNKLNMDKSVFGFANLHIVTTASESAAAKKVRGCVILAGSGMANGGKVMSYIESMVRSSSNMICFVGFVAEGTLGRQLTEGVSPVKIYNKNYKVNAKVINLSGFSAHADNDDLVAWLDRYNTDSLKKVYLVHADNDRRQNLRDSLLNSYSDLQILMPGMGEVASV